MIAPGDIVLFRFPQTDLRIGKLRPALLMKELPGGLDDWLVCMISSQMHQEIPGLDPMPLSNRLDMDFGRGVYRDRFDHSRPFAHGLANFSLAASRTPFW
jgi:hypothetical protein